MRVQYNNQLYEIPDSLAQADDETIRQFIESEGQMPGAQGKPSAWTYVKGSLQSGGKEFYNAIGNFANLVGAYGIENMAREKEAEAASMASYRATKAGVPGAQPPETFLGQLAYGLGEFAPQLVPVGGVEALMMKGLLPAAGKVLPGALGRGAAALPARLAATETEGLIGGALKAAGRGAIAGAGYGALTAEPGSTPLERAAHAGEESMGFAAGMGILHPAFTVLRKALAMATGRSAARIRSDADVSAALEKEEVRKKLLEDADVAKLLKEYEELRDAQAAVKGEYERAEWYRENQPFGQGYEVDEGFGEVPGGRKPSGGAPLNQSLVQAPAEPLPKLRESGEALKYGLQHPEREADLIAEWKRLDAEANEMRKSAKTPQDYSEISKKLMEAQAYREAAEGAAAHRTGDVGFIPAKRLEADAELRGLVEQVQKNAPAAEAPKPPAVAPKKLGIKYVPDDVGRELISLGASRDEIKAIAEAVMNRPLTPLAVRRELMKRAYTEADIRGKTPEKLREMLNRELVEEALDAEAAKRRPPVEEKPLQPTPEQLEQQRQMHLRLMEQMQDKRLRDAGIDPSTMTPEQKLSAFNKLAEGDVKEAVSKVVTVGKTDARGIELAEKVLELTKASPEFTPEKKAMIQADLARLRDALIERDRAMRDAIASEPADAAKRRRRLVEEPAPKPREATPEDAEIREWLEQPSVLDEAVEQKAPKPTPEPERKLETAEDFEKLLAEEGMPAEPDGFIADFAGLQQLYEMVRNALHKGVGKRELELLGRGLMLEGSRDYNKFKARIQDIAGPNWEAVKGNVGNLYKDSKAWIDNLEQNGVLSYHGTKVQFTPFLRDEAGIPGNKFISQSGKALTRVWFDPKHTQLTKEVTLDFGGFQQLWEHAVKMVKEGDLGKGLAERAKQVPEMLGRLRNGVVGSVSNNEQQLIKDITRLYTGGKIDADITYSIGAMYRGTGIEPKYKFDKRVQTPETIEADVAKNIPLPNNSVNSVMFDPPFIVANPAKLSGEKAYGQARRFTGFRTVDELWGFIEDAISESHRVLNDGGKLIVKIQDVAVSRGTSTRQNYFTTNEVYNFAIKKGFRPVDKFVYVNESPYIPPGVTGETQKIARKMHSEYWVFEKTDRFTYPKRGGVTLDFAGMQQGYEALLEAGRKIAKGDVRFTLPQRLQRESIYTKDGMEWLHDRTPPAEKIRQWEINSRQPLRVAEKIGGRVYDWYTKWNAADLSSAHAYGSAGGHSDLIKTLLGMLPTEAMQKELGLVVQAKAKPTSEAVAKASAMLRDALNNMWERRLKAERDSYGAYLEKDQHQALLEAIDKKLDPDMAFARFNKEEAKVLKSFLAEYKELEGKRIENYLTHWEPGNIVLRDKEVGGRVVAVAKNPIQAVQKALKLKEADPSLELWMDTHYIKDLPTGLTQGQYQAVVYRLAKKSGEILSQMNKEIAKSAGATAARGAMRGVFTIKPTLKFSPFELRRFETLKGEENPFTVLPAYFYTMERKIHLDPLIAEAREILKDMPGQPNATEFIQKVIEDTKGRYHPQDKVADDLIRWLGRKTGVESLQTVSGSASIAAGAAREAQAILKLGYRPVSAFFNYLGGQGNVWVQVGTEYFTKGYKFLSTPEGKAFIKDMEPVLGQSFAHEGDVLKPRSRVFQNLPWWVQPMGLFEKPEIPNRSIGVAAPYLLAKEKLGMSDADARMFAMRQNWFSQATYNIANMPAIMRSPLGRTIGQFKTYMVNQVEFMTHLRGPEVARYIAVQLAIGGPRAAVAFLKSVPVLAMFGFWDEMEQWLDHNLPRTSRGIGGLVGVDVTGPAAMQFPQTLTDWAGPMISDVIKLYNNVLAKYKEGEKLVPKTPREMMVATAEAAEQVSPLMKAWPKLLIDKIAHPTQDGYIIKDMRGREIYRLQNTDIWKVIAGAEPLESARIKQFEARQKHEDYVLGKRKAAVVDAVMSAMENGEEIPAHIWDEMIQLGIKPATLRREAKLRALSPEMRRIIQTELLRREQIMEKYPKPLD